jgi:hypothetical protein
MKDTRQWECRGRRRKKKKKAETSSYKGERENDSLFFFSLRPLFLKGGESMRQAKYGAGTSAAE